MPEKQERNGKDQYDVFTQSGICLKSGYLILNAEEPRSDVLHEYSDKNFGLGQHAMTVARELHLDKEVIKLHLLKKACWLDMKANSDHRHLYHNYQDIYAPDSLHESAQSPSNQIH